MNAAARFAMLILPFALGCTSHFRQAPRSAAMMGTPNPMAPLTLGDGNRPESTAENATDRRWEPPHGISPRWDTIVIHHSGTEGDTAQTLHKLHSTPISRGGRGLDELGYHFVISQSASTGEVRVEAGPRWWKQKHGAHCAMPGNWYYNDYGIGICVVGNFEERAPNPAQMAALTELVRYLVRECEIPVSRVHAHTGIGETTICPGGRFPMANLLKRLQQPDDAHTHGSPFAAAR